jgi:hypothetical protein
LVRNLHRKTSYSIHKLTTSCSTSKTTVTQLRRLCREPSSTGITSSLLASQLIPENLIWRLGRSVELLARMHEDEFDDIDRFPPPRQVSTPASEASDQAEFEDEPPVAPESQFRYLPPNRGKKDRQPIESMPIRVWRSTGPKKGGCVSIKDLSARVRSQLVQLSNGMVMKPAKRKSLWARWQDPVNKDTHYDQCIAHGLIAKIGKECASHHEACEFCTSCRLLCALLHKAGFIGILPLKASLREGYIMDDIEFWRRSR